MPSHKPLTDRLSTILREYRHKVRACRGIVNREGTERISRKIIIITTTTTTTTKRGVQKNGLQYDL